MDIIDMKDVPKPIRIRGTISQILREVPEGKAAKIPVTDEPIYRALESAIRYQHKKGKLLNLSMRRVNNVIYIVNSSINTKTEAKP